MALVYRQKLPATDGLIVEMDAAKCLTARAMYAEFAEAFVFPSSPNEGSLDVLLDFMRDLAWQKENWVEVQLKNVEKAKKKNLSNYNELVRLLELIRDHWEEASQNPLFDRKVYFSVTGW